MQSLYKPLTNKEKQWIKEYFRAEMNATEATRRVYGGTAISCKVKGHKKCKKLSNLLSEIYKREFHKMECQGISGIDFYLGNLQKAFERYLTFDVFIRNKKRVNSDSDFSDKCRSNGVTFDHKDQTEGT